MSTVRRKISTTVYLEPRQIAELKSISRETGVPFACYIRDMLDEFITSFRRGTGAVRSKTFETESLPPAP